MPTNQQPSSSLLKASAIKCQKDDAAILACLWHTENNSWSFAYQTEDSARSFVCLHLHPKATEAFQWEQMGLH